MRCSIVIPMYNESKYLGRCLDSLLHQTIQDFELIIVDDGSTDNSVEIAESYRTKFLHLLVLKQHRGGPGKARNRGANETKSDILVFVDADMMFDQKYLEELIGPIENHKEIGTAHGREYVANRNNPIARAFSLIRLQYDDKQKRGGIFRAILKSKFQEVGGFDTTRGYSDDNLSQHFTALSVPTSIAYHNNPELLGEIYHHSRWVGASLIKSGDILIYIKKYQLYLIALSFFLIGLIGVGWTVMNRYEILCSIFSLIVAFLLFIGIKRSIQEHFVSHLFYVPLIMIARGLGYLVGAAGYLIFRKIY
ncbi:MAG TPA: glycosyltransferase [Candidatus Absconditabacterales bacterium]|nr:glycosyltransferase [Candidatus Absconditabacterales bacterium]